MAKNASSITNSISKENYVDQLGRIRLTILRVFSLLPNAERVVEPDTWPVRPRVVNWVACIGCIGVLWGYLIVYRMCTLSRVALFSLSGREYH